MNMENSPNKSDIENSSNIAAKDWDRIINNAKVRGFRRGIDDGTDLVYQESFDNGYKEGFQTAFILGKFKSLLNSTPGDVEYPQNIKEILDKTRKGVCYMCATKLEDMSETNQKSFDQIFDEQRSYSVQVLQMLYEYFQPYVKQLNISESDILKMQDVPDLNN
ncbi:uncharacterized protein LOC122529655 isoform X1 [Frieseomelitta varia]|uniref:uncharacterized protein LOC122529655 isoform X1 n=2 Tax=Frieseomelitta varia TaxID=561572 RepID=UPI001CB68B11|nr:uncharacterized protein LOC122529655 isoform X1 [Frieseomelitta varia]